MSITVKSYNGQLLFVMDDEISYENLIVDLESLLESPVFVSDGFFPKAFFDFKCRIMDEMKMEQLLQVLFEKQVVIFSGVKQDKKEQPTLSKIKVINTTIHAGQELFLEQDTLIIGNINAGAVVNTRKKLYVLGKVEGYINATSKDSQINGQYFNNAHIRILGVSRHNFTSLELTMLYYNNKSIYEERGEMIHG